MVNRFGGNGLYLLDEPEAALSPQRQLAMLARLHQLVQSRSQFVIATHSPILMAYPDAWIYRIGEARHAAGGVRADRALPGDQGIPGQSETATLSVDER